MRFKLTTTGDFYTDADRIARLERLGFVFRPGATRWGPGHIKRNDPVFVDIGSLDELLSFVREHGTIVIDDDEIQIYDDYRE